MSKPLAYLLLGVRGAGKLDLALDLAEFGLDRSRPCQFWLSPSEAAAAPALPERLATWIEIKPYAWPAGKLELPGSQTAETLFLLADGASDPADAVEACFESAQEGDFELGRVISVVHCGLASQSGEARQWYDGCIHFSDAVILARREGVSGKWLSRFQERYRKERFPCLFELARKGRVKNPPLVLDPAPRRLSLLFDRPEPIESLDEADPLDVEAIEQEKAFGDPQSDPFLKRDAAGRRSRPLPDIRPVAEGEGKL